MFHDVLDAIRGVGSSGLGRYYGKYGFDSLSHAKSILVSPADVKVDALLPPYTEHKAASLGELFTVSNPDTQHQEHFSDGDNYAIQDFWRYRTSRFYPLPRYHDLARITLLTADRPITQASATRVGVASCRPATSSSASMPR